VPDTLEGERPEGGKLKPFQVRLYNFGRRKVKHPSSDIGDETMDVVAREIEAFSGNEHAAGRDPIQIAWPSAIAM
jgi:hypothetical protein